MARDEDKQLNQFQRNAPAPDGTPVIGPEKARQGTRNPMSIRVLILSLALVSAAFLASYAFFG